MRKRNLQCHQRSGSKKIDGIKKNGKREENLSREGRRNACEVLGASRERGDSEKGNLKGKGKKTSEPYAKRFDAVWGRKKFSPRTRKRKIDSGKLNRRGKRIVGGWGNL